jgi:5-methyltetrahydrofolate--homocysteine methyltransferase
MAHIAREMQRQAFSLPLLIGGATTSKLHTAIKIEPNYGSPVIHVLDASRSVGVVSRLLSGEKDRYVAEVRSEYEDVRRNHARRSRKARYLPFEDAKSNAFQFEWEGYTPPAPDRLGVFGMRDLDIETLIGYIDWSPFFSVWQLKGKFPQLLDDLEVGAEARRVYDDAHRMLKRIAGEKLLSTHAVYGLFPANRVGEDVEIYTDDARTHVRAVLHMLRQQSEKASGKPNRSLADYIAPRASGGADYIGMFAVTAGIGIERMVQQFTEEHDDYSIIMVKALADRLAEALAEWLHERIRKSFWGYAADEAWSNEDLIRESYQGIRPAPGYPACPDHTEKQTIWSLLEAEKHAGISLTESLAMFPAASVCGFYLAHPDADYFNLGLIGRDQVQDYAHRKRMRVEDVERWLAPRLNYDPERVGEAAGNV